MATAIQLRPDSLFVPALLGMLLCLGACHSTPDVPDCNENKGAYLTASEQAATRAPEGMEAPDRRNALKIPPGNGKSIDRKTCYQQAPAYFGTAGRIAASPEETVADWAQAWADRNSTAVLAMYSSQFTTDAPAGSAAWLAQRGKEVAEGPLPSGRVTNLRITQQGSDQRLAAFTQQFGTNNVTKILKLIREAGVWKIAAEQVVTATAQPVAK